MNIEAAAGMQTSRLIHHLISCTSRDKHWISKQIVSACETIPRMGKFQEMVSFVAVVDAGSFVRAAEATGQSKAAVSRHVNDLEHRLGVRLIHRTTRRLSLTVEGQVFHARCRELLAAIDEAESEISVQSGSPAGLLRVNAPH